MHKIMLVLSYIWNDKVLRYLLLASLIIVISMVVYVSNSGAEDNPCGFISSSRHENKSKEYINPKEISHIISTTDTSVGRGMIGRYIIIVVMNNGSSIVYGKYSNEQYRSNGISYITGVVYKCNQAMR